MAPARKIGFTCAINIENWPSQITGRLLCYVPQKEFSGKTVQIATESSNKFHL